MSEELWKRVDDYITSTVVHPDAALEEALAATAAAGMPPIAVSAPQGKLLALLATAIGATYVLEIGTLGGYSTIWMAQALPPDGKLISLEVDPHHAEVARKNIAAAGLDRVAEVRLGAALDTLPALEKEGAGPFDLSFVDADKVNNAAYFDWCVKLSRPGAVIVVDNVVRNGAVVDSGSDDPAVKGVRRLNDLLAGDTRVSATTIQTVGSKGYDGFAIAVVRS
ncbi:MAG TPA: O-methyltransferase [Acidimicrobiales bacterium]|nr:O-methyltransferase [Acidimicrobiales bacterium]